MGKMLFVMEENSEWRLETRLERRRGQLSKGHSMVFFMHSSLFSLESKPSVTISTTRLKSGELWGALALTWIQKPNQNWAWIHPSWYTNAQLSPAAVQCKITMVIKLDVYISPEDMRYQLHRMSNPVSFRKFFHFLFFFLFVNIFLSFIPNTVKISYCETSLWGNSYTSHTLPLTWSLHLAWLC